MASSVATDDNGGAGGGATFNNPRGPWALMLWPRYKLSLSQVFAVSSDQSKPSSQSSSSSTPSGRGSQGSKPGSRKLKAKLSLSLDCNFEIATKSKVRFVRSSV